MANLFGWTDTVLMPSPIIPRREIRLMKAIMSMARYTRNRYHPGTTVEATRIVRILKSGPASPFWR